MDIGKLPPLAVIGYPGTPAETVKQHALELKRLQVESRVSAGTASLIASVSIAAGKAVNIYNGQLRLADASLSIPALGISLVAASSGAQLRFMLGSGFIKNLSGLTAKSSIYLGNAGALLFAKPGSGFIQGLGYALSTTELFVVISQP